MPKQTIPLVICFAIASSMAFLPDPCPLLSTFYTVTKGILWKRELFHCHSSTQELLMFSHLIRRKIMIPWNGLQGPTWPTLLFPPLAAAAMWPHFCQIPNSTLRSVHVSSFVFLKHIPLVDFSTFHPLYSTLWTQQAANFLHLMAQRHLSERCFLPKRVAPAPAASVPFS